MQGPLQLFTAQNGMASARVTLPDKTVRHIHSTVDPSIEAKYFENLDFWGDCIVFAGFGLGYHLTRKTKTIPSTSLLVVIEYYDELIVRCKDLFSGLSNIVVYISFSSDSMAISSLLREYSPQSLQIVKHPASFDINKKFYDFLLAQFFIDKPKHSSAPVQKQTTAIMLYGNFFLEEEVRSALVANSIEPVLFAYNDHRFSIYYENMLMRLIQEKRPSFVISINMKGVDGNTALADITERFGVPVVVWFVDDPRPIVMHKRRSIKSNMIALSWEKSYLKFLENSGFAKAAYLPLATDPALFSPPAAAIRSSGSLGFVGTAMVDHFAGKIKEKFLWSDCLAPLVEKASDKVLSDPLYSLENSLEVLAKELSVNLPFTDEKNRTWLCTYIIHLASMKKRKHVVGGLLDLGVETFGDPEGWKHLLGPRVKTHPNLDYRKQLGDTYAKICVNVNITSCQMPSAVNQRVFDIPMAGSFVLSDDQNDLRELFDIPKEAVVYENLVDLRKKIAYYLAHENERAAVIAAAQKRIKNEHLYVHRIKAIIDMLK
jgi:spore maturation protein CgeB